MIVTAQSEAVYNMHFVPLRAVFLHQGSRKGRGFVPLGAVFLVFGCAGNTKAILACAWTVW